MLKTYGHRLSGKGRDKGYLLSKVPMTCFVDAYQLLVAEDLQTRPGLPTFPGRLGHRERGQLDPRIAFGEDTGRRCVPGQESGDDAKPAADLSHGS